MVNAYPTMKLRQVGLEVGVTGNGSRVVDGGNEFANGKGKIGLLNGISEIIQRLRVCSFCMSTCEIGISRRSPHAPVLADNVTMDNVSSSETPSTGAPSSSAASSEASGVGSSGVSSGLEPAMYDAVVPFSMPRRTKRRRSAAIFSDRTRINKIW